MRVFTSSARLVLALLVGCATVPPPPAPTPLPEVPSLREAEGASATRLTVVGTADLHGHLERLPLLSGYVEAIRAQQPTLLIDGGDMWQGTLASNLNEGAAVTAAYGVMRYDAATIGNHEFDYGPTGDDTTVVQEGQDRRGALFARAAEASFPVLAANLRVAPSEEGADATPVQWPNVQPTVMVERGGIQVGVVGVTTASTLRTTIAANVEDLAMEALEDAVIREATRLRADRGAQVIVVAAHAGGECTEFDDPDDLSSCDEDSEIFELARALPSGLVDVIVAGHTHKAIAHRVNGVAIISSWALGTHFGRVDLRLDDGVVVETRIHPPTEMCDAPPCEYGGAAASPNGELTAAVAPALEAAADRLAEQLGPTLTESFVTEYSREAPAGNLLADGLAALRPRADVVLLNAGGVRADFPAGPLTYGALYEVFPFDNRFATVTLTAEQLAAALSRNAVANGGVLILGKITAEVTCRRGVRVQLKDARGRVIPPSRSLRLVTSDYLATSSMFSALPEGAVEVEHTGPLMREALADWFRTLEGSLEPSAYFQTERPRFSFPGERPVRCSAR